MNLGRVAAIVKRAESPLCKSSKSSHWLLSRLEEGLQGAIAYRFLELLSAGELAMIHDTLGLLDAPAEKTIRPMVDLVETR
jgi:hypothetical protein